MLISLESPLFLDDAAVESWMAADLAGKCKTWKEIKDAISTSADEVSGWYGPGAYLAWLVTAYVAAGSSIWHAKSSTRSGECNKLIDGETLLALGYPIIAALDILVRLIRCKIDPGMNAAVFVLISSLTIIGPMSRLSWQHDDEDPSTMNSEAILPTNVRQWVLCSVRFTCHTILYAILGEPYVKSKLVIALYAMLFLLLLYSEITATMLSETYPYRKTVYRPRAERVLAFGIVQVVFLTVLLAFKISPIPETGARFWDLDQAAGFFITICSLLYSRVEGFRKATSFVWKRISSRLSNVAE